MTFLSVNFATTAGVVEDMWTPYKRLYTIFQLAITNPNDVTIDLELYLKKFKQNFINFLRNPVSDLNCKSIKCKAT